MPEKQQSEKSKGVSIDTVVVIAGIILQLIFQAPTFNISELDITFIDIHLGDR